MKYKIKDLVGQKFGKLLVLEIDKNRRGKRKKVCWICKCDCGNLHSVIGTSLRAGRAKSCGCTTKEILKNKNKEKNHFWKGGKYFINGYIKILKPEHPNSTKDGYILEHRYVMSKSLNRPLLKKEIIHHKNGIRTDNRIENLELITLGHSGGQSKEDMIKFCIKYLKEYYPEILKNE